MVCIVSVYSVDAYGKEILKDTLYVQMSLSDVTEHLCRVMLSNDIGFHVSKKSNSVEFTINLPEPIVVNIVEYPTIYQESFEEYVKSLLRG